MAIVKHIKSRNANYSAAINYLLFEHDEKTGKKIVDESGRSILRKEFYMDGLNCDPMSFDKECELTNAHFHKNKKREDIKSHHYIISYDPADVTENGLTGKRAQAISLELAKQMFPGYQALVVTHTDGHNESGNIHTHIVINSVRKTAVERQPYMDKPHEEAAGYKHRSTDKFMSTFKKTVMDRCQQEGLHQIDLLAPAERKITQKEYMAQKHGQQKLNEINQKIIEDGLKPTSTVFLTQKEYLRNAIDECAATSNSFDEFQSKLLELFQVSVIEHRGRYSYLHPDRQKRITERVLGTRYGKEHLEQTFLRKDPLTILYVRSHLRLVVNLQTNVKAMQSPAYAHRIKLSNLQQMANTIIYVQEHGFDTQSDLKNTLLASKQELKEMQTQFTQHRSDLRILNDQISNLVVETSGTHGFTNNGIRTVRHIPNFSKAFISSLDCFLVILIIRLFLQSDFRTLFKKIISEIMFCSCQCDKYFCHYKCSFLRNHIHLDPVRHLPVLLFVHLHP